MNCDVTYEELAALAAGDLPADREAEVLLHLPDCPRCRNRMEAVRRADAALKALPPCEPPVRAVLAARRALAGVVRQPAPAEVMTLEEVGEFLRLTPDQLDQVAEELPAFELAGQVRIRRAALLEWVQQRERDYARQTAGSLAARIVSGEPEQGAL